MAAFTGRNKDNYYQTDLSTVQTNVFQPGFCRTSSAVFTEIVELKNTEFGIPQNNFKYLSVQEELPVLWSKPRIQHYCKKYRSQVSH